MAECCHESMEVEGVPDKPSGSRGYMRYLILCLTCFAMFGSYFTFDLPSSLLKQFTETYSLSLFEFTLFSTIYSFPNIVLPFFGGILVDRVGPANSMILFTSLLVVGQLVFSFGTLISSGAYTLMLVGRTILGFGGECLCVASSAFVATLFKGKEVAFAMGLSLSISRLGSVVVFLIMPSIYDSLGLSSAVWFTTLLLGSGLVGVVAMSILSRGYMKNPDHVEGVEMEIQQPGETVSYDLEAGRDASKIEKEEKDEHRFRLSDIYEFEPIYWVLSASCVIVYATIAPFISIGGGFLQSKYGFGLHEADMYISIPYTISAISTPFIGIIVDRLGKRAYLLLMSAAALFTAHFAFFAIKSGGESIAFPICMLVLMGIAYSVYAT
eukprot:521890_1